MVHHGPPLAQDGGIVSIRTGTLKGGLQHRCLVSASGLLHGTTAKNKKTAKMTKCTMPCSTVVRPVPNVIMPRSRVTASKT